MGTVPVDPPIAELYRDGVAAVCEVSGRISADQWSEPACGEWTALETSRHLVAVAGWYHQWLDRAESAMSEPPFPARDLDRRNNAAISELDQLGPDEAVTEFRDKAMSYVDRATQEPDLAFGFPFGTVTVGLHLGVAAAEWHLHAWDLSSVVGPRHIPSDPGGLFVAAGRCVAAATGGLRGAALARVVPLGARRSPWPTLLRRSGRPPA